MNVRRTRAWKAAEWDYAEIYALLMAPLLGPRPLPETVVDRMEAIAKKCPEFYPAVLDSGLRRLAEGDGAFGEQRIEQGFHLMLKLAEPQHIEEELDALISNLEKLWRFDVCERCLNTLVERYPQNALFQDSLAHAMARLGHVDVALAHIAKAVEMDPENKCFRSNQGWIHLIAGDLREAGEALAEALVLAPDDEVVRGNLEIHRYLTQHPGNYLDYLLRPVDMEEIDRLADEEKWEEVDAQCDSYNEGRIEAMAQTLLQEDEQARSRLSDLVSTLRTFFGFVRGLYQDYFLSEDLFQIQEYFKPMMHKFIFKFKDVDRTMIEDIYESLFVYYGFLTRKNLVRSKDFKRFQKATLAMKKDLIHKMERYNAIRRDGDMDEDEKEAIRDELFEGDHAWPVL